MTAIVTRFFTLSFPQELIREPILHNLHSKFGVAFCINRANVTESVGFLELSFSGPEAKINEALNYMRERGVEVREVPAPISAEA